MRNITIGGAQLGPIQKADGRSAVVERMVGLLEEAHRSGCGLVVFPELALTTFFPRWFMEDQREVDSWFETEMPNTATQPLFEKAREHKIAISFGYAELTPEGHHYNTSILTDRDGAIIAKYRKVHLPGHAEFDPDRAFQHLEKRYFEPGDLGFPVWRALDGIVGMCICNDRRWPETYRVLGLQGVELVLLGYNTPAVNSQKSTEGPERRLFQHRLCLQAGAYQNSTWVVSVAKAGVEDGHPLIGGSVIVDPNGEIVVESKGEADELIVHDCDLDACTFGKKTIFDFARHRRSSITGSSSNRPVSSSRNPAKTDEELSMPEQRLTEDAKGVYIISATPFRDDGSMDLASTDRLVDFYLEHEVTGMTILGMMGEAPKLAPDEAEQFVNHVMSRVRGQIPVIVGVSNAGIDNLVRLTNVSMEAGAAGVMVAPIGGLNTEEKIYRYYRQVFEALGGDVPVCYQDYPQSTGVHISVDCLHRLVADFPQLVMLKHEDCPGFSKLSRIVQAARAGETRRISILVGNGGLYLPQELARGADGAMTGFAYPEMLVGVVAKFAAGEAAAAENLFDAYLPLVKHEQQPGFGLAVRKEVLRRRGVIASAKVRAPGPALTREDQDELSRLIERLERRLQEIA